MRTSNDRDFQPLNVDEHLILFGLFKIDTCDLRQNIDPTRRHPRLDNRTGCDENLASLNLKLARRIS